MAKQKAAGEAPTEKITQKEAVRRALAAGKDSPSEGVVYVREQFGIALKDNQAFSTLKSQINKAAGATGTGKRGRPPAPATVPAAARSTNAKAASSAELARAVKGLIATYGAGEVAAMVTVLSE
jgi:hypothetical protein